MDTHTHTSTTCNSQHTTPFFPQLPSASLAGGGYTGRGDANARDPAHRMATRSFPRNVSDKRMRRLFGEEKFSTLRHWEVVFVLKPSLMQKVLVISHVRTYVSLPSLSLSACPRHHHRVSVRYILLRMLRVSWTAHPFSLSLMMRCVLLHSMLFCPLCTRPGLMVSLFSSCLSVGRVLSHSA